MLSDYFYILIFSVFGIVFVISTLFVSKLIKASLPEPAQLIPYECGEESKGTLWNKYHIPFYPFAFIFIIFEVTLVFLFLWAIVFKQLGVMSFILMMIFLGIILVGFIYAWGKGDLEIDKEQHLK